MPSLSLLIKPASSLCNMGCRYCFYRDVAENRNTKSFGIMKEETLDAMVKNVFSYADVSVHFTFQGGEPTLAGEAFFSAFHASVEKYNTRSLPVSFSLQTNGYDISDALIRIFSKYRYLLGVSLDGSADIHNSLRTTVSDNPTYKKIKETLGRLDAAKIDYNILTVVTEEVARRGSAVYKYLRDSGYKFIQFITHVPDFGREGEHHSFTLTNESYAKFLTETFLEYRKDFLSGNYVSVRQLDNFVRIAAGLGAECCGMGGRCYSNLVVESDGGVYPCDFYVLDKWKMGSVTVDSIESLLSCDTAKEFVRLSLDIPDECRACKFLPICRGGCRRHREDAEGGIGLNRYCSAYKKFFSENLSLILDMARRLSKK